MCNFWNFLITDRSNDRREIWRVILILTHVSQSVMKKSINFIFKLFVFNFCKFIDFECFMRVCHNHTSFFENVQNTMNVNKTDLMKVSWCWKYEKWLIQNIKQICWRLINTRLYNKLILKLKWMSFFRNI